MKKYVAWVALEADDTVASAAMMELLLMGPINDLIDRGFILRGGVKAREVKEGEEPPIIPPEMMQ